MHRMIPDYKGIPFNGRGNCYATYHTTGLKIRIEYNTMEEAKSEDLRIPRLRGSFQGRKPCTRALDDEGGKGRNCGMFRNGELSNLAGAQCTWEK